MTSGSPKSARTGTFSGWSPGVGLASPSAGGSPYDGTQPVVYTQYSPASAGPVGSAGSPARLGLGTPKSMKFARRGPSQSPIPSPSPMKKVGSAMKKVGGATKALKEKQKVAMRRRPKAPMRGPMKQAMKPSKQAMKKARAKSPKITLCKPRVRPKDEEAESE